MNRLTHWTELLGETIALLNDNRDVVPSLIKLAQYEDTGLEPEEITEVQNLLNEVITKYETSVKLHAKTTEILNRVKITHCPNCGRDLRTGHER